MYFQRLEDLRVDNDKTQIEIAEYLNLNRNVYWRYEKGEREIPVWAVIKLADYYRVSTDYLLGLKNRQTLDVSGLSAEQILHLQALINDLKCN